MSENFGIQEKVFYQDELGVLPDYRGQGVAKRMFIARLQDAIKQENRSKIGVVRTREFPEPSVTFLWFTKKLGYTVLCRYPKKDGRVILAVPISNFLH